MADVTYALAITQDDALEAPQQMDLETGWKVVGTATAAQGTVQYLDLTSNGGLYLLDVGSTKKTIAQTLALLDELTAKLRRGYADWSTSLPTAGAFGDLPTGSWTAD